MERAAHEKRRDKETGRLKKKQRLRTSQDVYNRIMWDTARYNPASFIIGYLDRFDGMMEIALDEFVPIDKGGDIAYHRVYYFRQGDDVLWDRNKRIDNIFGSGDTAAAAAATAAATTTTTTTTTSSDDSASSASEEDEGEDQPSKAAAALATVNTEQQPSIKSNQESMPKMRSCGFLLFADVAGSQHFLLMKHGRRYDLPKGHVESGETDRECALREVREETGIGADAIRVDPRFSYTETYYPVYKRLGGKTVEKTLRIFVGHINDTAVRDPTGFPVVRRTEHGAHEWVKWNPPHHLQKNTIDPLLKTASEHFKQLKEEEREKAARKLEQGDVGSDDDDDDEDEDQVVDDVDAELRTEVAEAGTVERTAEKEKLEKERLEKAERERVERELKVRRRTDYNARKTRRQRNAMVSGGGYALLDKVRDETGRGQVGIYEDDITFDESALNAQAKLILKRNDRANRRLDETVHNYTGDDGSDDDEISDEEAAQYVVSRSPKGKLGEFLDMAPSRGAIGGAEENDDDVAAAIALSATTTTLTTTSSSSSSSSSGEEEWSCQACTYVNKPTFLCCEVCASQRS